MINRLALVIHWIGFFFGCLLLCSLVVFTVIIMSDISDSEYQETWYWFVLGGVFSPLLFVFAMIPACTIRFILTGEKVFFPWRNS